MRQAEWPSVHVTQDAREILLRIRLERRVHQVVRVRVDARDRALVPVALAALGGREVDRTPVVVLRSDQLVVLQNRILEQRRRLITLVDPSHGRRKALSRSAMEVPDALKK